jgi:uncharacterized membrane protein
MEPQRLQAGRGWEWIKQGYKLFMQAPLLWVVMMMICLAAIIAIAMIPLIGKPLVSLLTPVIVVGVMAGCRALHNGEELELPQLFSGFHKHTSPLVTLGGITLISQYLILGVMMLVGGGAFVSILMSSTDVSDPSIIFKALVDAELATIIGAGLFGIGLSSLLLMATQFAPMIIYFNNAPPVAAMKLSISAFTRNVAPMLVYSVTFVFLAILASLPMFLGWLVLLPVIFTSLYAAYIDIFPPIKDAATAPTANDIFSRDESHF